jgi:cation:H+ antiporter
MTPALLLLAGAVCAAAGGELFVRGAVGLARWARVSPGIVAATVVAFATSSPELSVSVNSALAGNPEVALGDALGSNVVNVALILGLAVAVAAIRSPRERLRRDLSVALLVPVATAGLCLDGTLSRLDGVVMLAVFAGWLFATAREAQRTRSAAGRLLGAQHHWVIVLSFLAGLTLLVAAGRLIVLGALGLAAGFGIDAFIVGATVVAVGTSVPELATVVVAQLRGHDDVSLGAVLGSNIFNGLFIVGTAASIHPIGVAWRDAALALGFGVVALLAAYPQPSGLIDRWRAAPLLGLYALYVLVIWRM